MSTTPAGWHPDPRGRHEHRYWDGSQWTDHVADSGVMGTDPVNAVTPDSAPSEPSRVDLPAVGAASSSSAEPEPERAAEPAAVPASSGGGVAADGGGAGAGPLWAGDPAAAGAAAADPGPQAHAGPTGTAFHEAPAQEARTEAGGSGGSGAAHAPAGARSPDLAALLSVVAPGSGHLYLGAQGPQRSLAFGLLGATVVAVVLAYFNFLTFLVGLVLWGGAAAFALLNLRGSLDGIRDTRLSANLVGIVLVAAGATLVLSLILPYYHFKVSAAGFSATENASGFQVFELIDLVLVVVGVAALLAGLASLGKGPISSDELPSAMPAIVAVGGLVALGLLVFRLFVDPVPGFPGFGGNVDVNVGRAPGILLGTAAALAMVVASASVLSALRRRSA